MWLSEVCVTGCGYWSVITWGFDTNPDMPPKGRLAKTVFDARYRLGALSKWDYQWQKVADTTAEDIEATMNGLCMNPDVTIARLSESYEWELMVEVAPAKVPPGMTADGVPATGILGIAVGVGVDAEIGLPRASTALPTPRDSKPSS